MAKLKLKPKLMVALITKHALQRFRERWRPLDEYDEIPRNQDEWLDKFRAVLMDSTKVDMGRVARVMQMLNHNFEEASYFNNLKYSLQFIVIHLDSSPVVKTVIWKGREYKPEDDRSSGEEGAQ